jgi:LacI family transcriptional regulator
LFSANNASTIWVIEALREMKIEMGIDVALVDSTTSTSIL